jgi:large subunit ribosomal protein L6
MSRIGKQPVVVPAGVKVAIAGRKITIEGKLGKLEFEHRPEITVAYDEAAKEITFTRQGDERLSRSLHGLTRSLVANMVEGVTNGYQKTLEINGVGYSAKQQGRDVALNVGYADVKLLQIPDGVTVDFPSATRVVVKGADKQVVGDFAARIRKVRPCEPYQGKGIKYSDEIIRRKAGKAFAGAGGG